ncbi:MAG: hypothetical protein WBM02_02700 [bacterium]
MIDIRQSEGWIKRSLSIIFFASLLLFAGLDFLIANHYSKVPVEEEATMQTPTPTPAKTPTQTSTNVPTQTTPEQTPTQTPTEVPTVTTGLPEVATPSPTPLPRPGEISVANYFDEPIKIWVVDDKSKQRKEYNVPKNKLRHMIRGLAYGSYHVEAFLPNGQVVKPQGKANFTLDKEHKKFALSYKPQL